jgi:hypothetical protein
MYICDVSTSTIFLHAHLQVVYYKCVKFHKNPISSLEGVALTRYMDGRTDRVIPIYPPNFVCGGIIKLQKNSEFRNGLCTVLFAPPEAVLKKCWRDALQTFKEQICVVAYDEAHCISEWYVLIFFFPCNFTI